MLCTRFPQLAALCAAAALGLAAPARADASLEARAAAGGAAVVGASAAGLVIASGAFALSTAMGAPDDPWALAVVLGAAPLATGLGALSGAVLVRADRAWVAGLAGLGGAGIAAGAAGAIALWRPELFDDDLGAALLLLVAAPTLGGALCAGAVAPIFAVAEE